MKRKAKKKEPNIGLIKCTQHGRTKKLPWSIVCVHLQEIPQRWYRVKQDPEIGRRGSGYDYYCAKCFDDLERMMNECDITHLRPACCECVESMRFLMDLNHESNRNLANKKRVYTN